MCEGQRVDSYIKGCCDIQVGRLAGVSIIFCHRFLAHDGLLMSSQILRLWMGAGYLIHGIIGKFADGVLYNKMLYDNGL